MGALFGMLFGILVVLAGIFGPSTLSNAAAKWGVRLVAGFFGGLIFLFSAFSTSFLVVGDNETGHYTRQYLGSSMPDGQIIALDGQQGPSAEIWGPGLHIVPFMGLLGDFETLPTVVIPDGHFGVLVANDGQSLAEDAVAAAALPGTSISASIVAEAPRDTGENVFDAVRFLTSVDEGGFGGQKGLQSTVLKPGEHRINLYLFSVRVTDANGQLVSYYDENGLHTREDARDITGLSNVPTTTTQVPTGYVGVVRSNINEGWNQYCDQTQEVEQGQLVATLVPVGCKGVWQEPLTPGDYFLNPAVYDVTLIATRAQRFEYQGGYTPCRINLSVSADGQITQERVCESARGVPSDAADRAINVRSEGWDIPVELRVLGQVTAEQAPAIVAAVGDLEQVEDRIITPMIRSVVRNVGGGRVFAPVPDTCVVNEDETRTCTPVLFEEDTPHPYLEGVVLPAGSQAYAYRPTRALDFYEHREALEAEIENAIISASSTGGINVLEVTMGEPAVPPELVIAQQREQLADQLRVTFAQEERAQQARIASEQQRATADQQGELVRAQIYAQTQEQRGNADRLYLEQLAAGQRAQAQILGEEATQALRELELQLEFQRSVVEMVVNNPEVIGQLNLPNTVLFGGGGMENAAAILSESGFNFQANRNQ
mgnify:CR=1 FL=1